MQVGDLKDADQSTHLMYRRHRAAPTRCRDDTTLLRCGPSRHHSREAVGQATSRISRANAMTNRADQECKLPHLFLSGRLDRLVRVLHQALSPADRARDVEATVEIPQVLRRFEG